MVFLNVIWSIAKMNTLVITDNILTIVINYKIVKVNKGVVLDP